MSRLFADPWQLWTFALAAKVCVVLALAGLLTQLMRRRPAAERHFVWVLAVAAVLILPAAALIVPTLDVPVRLPASMTSAATSLSSDVVTPAEPIAATQTVAPTAPFEAAPSATMHEAVAPTASFEAVPSAAMHDAPAPAPAQRRSIADWLLVVWLSGALVILCGTLLGFAQVQRTVRRSRPLTDVTLIVRARGIAAELGVTRRVRMLEGDVDQMPMTFGIVNATLLLPRTAREWSSARQTTVLRHELAHIRRRDSLTQLAAELACMLYWFNPLVWFAAHRLYVEREHACDDLVLVSGSRPADYASELLEIARTTRVRRAVPIAAIAMARPSQLRVRIMAVLDQRARRAALSGRMLVPAWLGAAALILPISSLAPSLRSPTRHVKPPQAAVEPEVAPKSMRTSDVSAPHKALPRPHPGPVAPITVLSSTSPIRVTVAPITFVSANVLSGSVIGMSGAAAQQDCLTNGRKRSINHNTNDRRSTIKWSADGCSGEVTIEGDLQFDADFTTITGISRGGSVRMTVEEGRDERRLLIRPDNGALTYEYSVNGRRTEFDAAGQRWLSSTMLVLFRHVGLMAEQRATAILERRGADALLSEVGLLSGDYVRAKYLTVLVDKGRLNESALRRVLELAGNTLSSDHYRTEVITAAAGRYEFTDGVRQAYIDAAARMGSDHYKYTAFAKVVDKGNLSAPQLSAVLREARRISSDHYRAQLLGDAASRYSMTPEIRGAYLDAAAGMSSDHYKADVLRGLLGRDLNGAELARVVDATQSIKSDHYRADLLTKVGGMNLRDATLQAAFIRAASGIKSDHYKQNVLSKAAARSDLDRAALHGMLDAAATISSDHYLSELLIQIAKQHQLEGDTRERFMRVMDRIGSSHYKGNVATVLLRRS